MGQQIGREQGARVRRRNSTRESVDVRPSTDNTPPQPEPEPVVSADTRVAGGFVVPQGVYKKDPGGDQAVIRSFIVEKRLAPFYPPLDDDDDDENGNECPICFMSFPTDLNYSRCCHQPICTECFVQIKRAPPNPSADPPSRPAACPFCVTDNFGVIFSTSAHGSIADSTEAVLARTEVAFGTGGAGSSHNVVPADDPRVVLTDSVHPEWEEQLAKAIESVARCEMRRVIMRQVGDTVVPIGVSSSRMGHSIAEAIGHNAALGRSVQGGNIVLAENVTSVRNETQPRQGRNTFLRRSLNRARRHVQPEPRTRRSLDVVPREIEDLMLAEAMRRSMIDHEREVAQRKAREEEQRQAAEASPAAPAAAPAAVPSALPAATATATPTPTTATPTSTTAASPLPFAMDYANPAAQTLPTTPTSPIPVTFQTTTASPANPFLTRLGHPAGRARSGSVPLSRETENDLRQISGEVPPFSRNPFHTRPQ
ncbi:SNF1-interacting protein [Malassezia cuniculi]|uniref:SNF1-interacting protein n=1 Tax=Malassezia cuniculi TaxID=948313 RepID=A0AAF0J5B7_9BASI|nr:SNF1-interacting protein [Malassezia cuniculi]